MDEPEVILAALFCDTPRPPDAQFVAQVDALVQLDQAFALRRRRAWRRFASDIVVAGAMALPALGLSLGSAAGLIGTDHVALIACAIMIALAGWAATNRWASV
ncbi:MAG: hypothetical protein C0476_00535 [Sphingomonas sp.]|nr:hypothetical protein [Sphingomonas sp.]